MWNPFKKKSPELDEHWLGLTYDDPNDVVDDQVLPEPAPVEDEDFGD